MVGWMVIGFNETAVKLKSKSGDLESTGQGSMIV